ncbi:hypothetical protein CL2_23210 [Anaerostipes hadrus]|uniref:Uncharacterized protein n=1 Tax=Anaerostipes hadrus TaxID=649756 RepID=D4MUW4_ANAHA|nr:hypothetical protein CL2_23210 [Anaerostipes hadrus]
MSDYREGKGGTKA